MLKLENAKPSPGETCGHNECNNPADESFVWRDERFVFQPICTCSRHADFLLGILMDAKPDFEDAVLRMSE